MGKVSDGGDGSAGERRGKGRELKQDSRKSEVGGRNNSKHRGSVAEMRFMIDAAERGFGVAKPFVDNERYDVVVDASWRLWRVQVKASRARHHKGFAVRACWRTSKRHMPYTAKQIDFMAVVVQAPLLAKHARNGAPKNRWDSPRVRRIWYLIPVRALGGRLTIHLYPFGCRKGSEERFEKYREAWGLLEGE